MEKQHSQQHSQLEHRQPIEQTRGLICMCDSCKARCQSRFIKGLLPKCKYVNMKLHKEGTSKA